MKKIAIFVFFTVGFFVHVWACTGLIAGKQATIERIEPFGQSAAGEEVKAPYKV